ncbi:oxygen-evolving enhancer protein 1 [Musa troglodytarum]|uniref:Oxygen-evolving enhancer protein 1 n=1 Tax=Musa troglodytarum TaxID=320322 RepID=A0A9E7KVD3_9LILI|nr:oxygen-evolving enhancer protein 1 [Musa troglodytarum]
MHSVAHKQRTSPNCFHQPQKHRCRNNWRSSVPGNYGERSSLYDSSSQRQTTNTSGVFYISGEKKTWQLERQHPLWWQGWNGKTKKTYSCSPPTHTHAERYTILPLHHIAIALGEDKAMACLVHRPRKLMQLSLLGFLLLPFLFLVVLKPRLDPSSFLSLQVSVRSSIRIEVVEEKTSSSDDHDDKTMDMPIALESRPEEKKSATYAAEMVQLPPPPRQQNHSEMGLVTQIPNATKDEEEATRYSAAVPSSKISCDFSQRRSDTCIMHGDVRVLGSSILLVKTSTDASSSETTWRIKPYARKWEAPVMELIRELPIRVASEASETPNCTARHAVPAVVFSTGGFSGKNFFHDFSDVLIPLFITSRRYHGEVQFLVTNFNPRWINRYEAILKRLSNYEVVDMDRDDRVRCFRNAHVGLMSHSELVIDPAKAPNNYSMADFRELLRSCFSLRRKSVRLGGSSKPRLLLMLRKGSRSLTNKRAVMSLARRLGFRVVVAGPEQTKNLSRFAVVVNSCDVMVGVHGAGLTNMLFLPANATLIQIIPWGGLRYASNHDYGDPTAAMGIRYSEYEVRQEESSLVKQYPIDHPVFTDPLSIHRQGWNALWSVFLDRQSIKLDVRRFRGVLQETIRSLPR